MTRTNDDRRFRLLRGPFIHTAFNGASLDISVFILTNKELHLKSNYSVKNIHMDLKRL